MEDAVAIFNNTVNGGVSVPLGPPMGGSVALVSVVRVPFKEVNVVTARSLENLQTGVLDGAFHIHLD